MPLSAFPRRLHIHHSACVKIWTDGLTLTFSKVSHARRVLHLVCVCICPSMRAVMMLILDHCIFSRGLLHRRLPMSASSRACRYAGRWRQVGLWLGPRRQTKAMRHILIRSVPLLLSMPQWLTDPPANRHQRRVVVRTRLVATCSRLRGMGI